MDLNGIYMRNSYHLINDYIIIIIQRNNNIFNNLMNPKNEYQIQNETKLLLDDSINKESNFFTLSAIQRKFNNTQQLLDDKTSILYENQSNHPFYNPEGEPSNQTSIKNKDRASFIFEDKDSIMNNLDSSHSFNDDLLMISNTTKTLNEIKTFQINPELDYSDNRSSMLSFGSVYPTAISTLQYKLKNISNQSTTIAFRISDKANVKEHFEAYDDICNNSNLKYNCFRIANEKQKVTLQQNEEIVIEIELNAPYTKSKENIFSLVEIYNNNFIDKSIPLFAQIEIPKLCCLKSIQNATSQTNCRIPVIPVRLELKSKGQRYRLPFKNMAIKDLEIEIGIDSKKNKTDSFWYNYEYYKCQFVFFPNHLIVPAQGVSNLEMIAKISKGIIDENSQASSCPNQLNQRSIRKIITAKVKGTKVAYSFFLEAFLFEL